MLMCVESVYVVGGCNVVNVATEHGRYVAVMVSYNLILHVCELCGNKVCREFFGEPNSSPHA